MNLLSDVITYIRRIIKSPSNSDISDDLLIDYINRFWIMDVDARVQLFDLKTKYSFQTTPGVDRYNMPLYNVQTETVNYSQSINFYPVYQGFLGPAYVNGVPVSFSTEKNSFFNIYPNIVQYSTVLATGNGTTGPYTLSFPVGPNNSSPLNTPINSLIRGHVDITGIIATGSNNDPFFGTTLSNNAGTMKIPQTSIDPAVYFTSQDAYGNNIIVQDSGQFLNESGNNYANYGLLMSPGTSPYNYSALIDGGSLGNAYTTTQNTINYLTGVATNVYFPVAIPDGVNINGQCRFYQSGLPRAILYYNNTLTLRTVPSNQFLVELDAYMTPAAFLNSSSAIQFAYMAEYIARGAARKILSDTGDIEQFNFYEPLFLEQEQLVRVRAERQWTSTRTQTIYSQGLNRGQTSPNNYTGGI